MRIIVALLVTLLIAQACKTKNSRRFGESVKIYPLSPFQTMHYRDSPVVVSNFLIVESDLKNMSNVKDSVLMYIGARKDSLIYKKDTITDFLVYKAEDNFDHTYKQTHPDPLGNYDKNFVLHFRYRNGALKDSFYIIYKNSERQYSIVPPELE